MKVQDVMTPSPHYLEADSSIEQAAKLMREHHVGVVPVGENDRLIGMVTDRDLVLRALSEGKGPDTPVKDCMTGMVLYCYSTDDVADVAANMQEQQVQRLIVLDKPDSKSMAGVISLSDIATAGDNSHDMASSISSCSKRYQRAA
ncbi:CBS domain-containing protein [Alloalcanivorax mobilis]|uniref:CBS domain-containing protein n=1 Tax=Alloalcanivorax mobilis TaxID=2019569 RepID=UPI000B5B4189|nr:CBS domain-containing protein [Alloalcanivorax mobilis]ASK35934.1 CBS domain-containing protein [Alcanivorax sp. N3-2A]|tara:strand:- start:88700 stop:89134 length:435 start_codon:yes stop_codon:yes gene_type:complete